MIPDDTTVCIQLDMDEILEPGWRSALESSWSLETTRLRYLYNWSFCKKGLPEIQFFADKIHHRYNYYWKYSVHETLYYYNDINYNDINEKISVSDRLTISHYPDKFKSRSQYLPLLAFSVQEYPEDARVAHYYARELMFHNKFDLAIKEFKRHLNLQSAVWDEERSASMRYIAACLKYQKKIKEAENWLFKAIAECDYVREPVMDLAILYYEIGDWESCLAMSKKALNIKNKTMSYMNDEKNWRDLPYDLAGISCYHLNLLDMSLYYFDQALKYDPENTRLLNNLDLVRKKIQSSK
jgi:tetratricopeptide (TPR) repeat protein